MYFDENEMLEICKKYGIDVIEKEGYPLCNGRELNDSFSIRDIMNDICNIAVNMKTIYTETLDLKVSIGHEDNGYTNCSLNNLEKTCYIKRDNDGHCDSEKSLILNDNNISIAA